MMGWGSMPEITELVLATLVQSQRRVEIASQNLANAATPAYKRKLAFTALVRDGQSNSDVPQVSVSQDNRPGKIIVTGKPTDMAVMGEGYFAFGADTGVVYSRQAQLTIDAGGKLVNSEGFALQLVSGNDLVVKSSSFEVRSDGQIFDKGELLGRVAVYGSDDQPIGDADALEDRSATTQFSLLPSAIIEQGAIEGSNVNSGDEMVAMMEALRRAEAGQRVMSTYDDLMGRVITSFGEAAR
jgi:flagellar basal-body rod protein FlgF